MKSTVLYLYTLSVTSLLVIDSSLNVLARSRWVVSCHQKARTVMVYIAVRCKILMNDVIRRMTSFIEMVSACVCDPSTV